MNRPGAWPLLGALILFVIFFANVALGAAGVGAFMPNLAAMLTLLLSSVLFVVGILEREAEALEAGRDLPDESSPGPS